MSDPTQASDACSQATSVSYSVGGRVGVLFLMFGISALGICLPILSLALEARGLGKSTLNTALTSVHARAFGLGIILCVTLVHLIPDALDLLTSECLHLSDKVPSITMTVVLGSALLMQTMSSFSYKILMSSMSATRPEPVASGSASGSADHDIEDGPAKGKVHAAEVALQQSPLDGCHNPHLHGGTALAFLQKTKQNTVAVILLEIGIAVHSIIIGIDLGIHEDGSALRSLVVALCFHQFFEGLAVGTALIHAKLTKRWILVSSALLFAASLPVGCAIGIGLHSSFPENSKSSLYSRGIINAAAAGILLYTGFVDLMAGWFGNSNNEFHAGGWAVVGGSNFFIWLGAIAMAILASWA